MSCALDCPLETAGGGAPEDLSLPQIKSYIKEEGLRVTGNKQELIDRIKEYIK